MLPFPGVVSSVNISDRFYLGVEAKTLPRYFEFVSHKRSSTLVSTDSSGTGSSLLLHKVLILMLARRAHQDFLDILASCALLGCGISRHSLMLHQFPSQKYQFPSQKYLLDALISNYLNIGRRSRVWWLCP
jgi:hypothetical protein